MHIGAQGHRVLHAAFHFLPQDAGSLLGLRLRGLHDQFVVDGQNQAAGHFFVPQALPHPHHSQLDYVRSGALNGGVAGHALAAGAHVEVGAGQLRQGAAAAEQGGHIAVCLCIRDGLVHIAAHAGKSRQIVLEEGVRFLHGHADILGKAVCALAVHDTEVDSLGRGAQPGRHLALRDAVDLGGGAAVDVLAVQKGLLHMRVPGDMRQNAQFDLAVIRIYQHTAWLCNKVGAQLAAQLGADGDILQIGIIGGEPSGAGFGLVEGGVDAPVLANDLEQTLHIGGVQLLVGAVLQNVLHQRVLTQAFQRFGIGRPAALGLFAVGQTHGVEQHLAQLFGAVGVEGSAAGLHVDAGQHLFQFLPQLYAELLDAVLIHQHAGAGHVGQHLCQRELDLVIQRILAAGGDLGLHPGKQVGQPSGVRVIGAGKGGSGLVGGDQFADLVLGGRGVQQIGGQFAVPDDAAAPAAGSHGFCVQGRSVEHIQRHVGVVQQPQQLGILQRIDGGILHGVPAFRLQYHVAGALLAGNGGAGGHQIVPGRGQG